MDAHLFIATLLMIGSSLATAGEKANICSVDPIGPVGKVVGKLAEEAITGSRIRERLALQGFSCPEPKAGTAYVCRGKMPYPESVTAENRYPEDVVLMIPREFHSEERLDSVFHLHGWLSPRPELGGRVETFDDVLAEFKFEKMMEDSGRNAVMVVPSSKGKCDTYREFLAPPARYHAFMKAFFLLMEQVGAGKKPGNMTVSAHSGAYSTLAQILNNCQPDAYCYSRDIREVFLLETLYDTYPSAGQNPFVQYVLRGENNRLISAYNPQLATKTYNEALRTQLDAAALPAPSLGADVPASQLASSRLAFIRSDAGHWATVSKYLPLLLKK